MTVAVMLSVALGLPFAAHAADRPSFDPEKLSMHVKTLSSDDFEGRGPNTPGEEKTVAYLIEQFKAAGLQPGGDKKDGKRLWTQAVPLARFEMNGPVSASVSFQGKSLKLVQGNDLAIRAAMNGSNEVSFKNAPVVFVGYGVKAPERQWDDFKGVDLKGKIAMVLINDPDFETGKGDFGGKAMTYYGRWTYKFEEIARQGAIGTLIIHETAPASYGWPTVKNSNTNVMFDIVRQDPSKAHAPMEAWIQRNMAMRMLGLNDQGFEALKKKAQSREFQPVTLKGITFSANYKVSAQTIVSQNVAARLEGSRNPKSTVIYSAHWDHLGVGAPDAKGDKIYNGAVDNATGISALIELAKAYGKAPKTHRSVVFLAVTAEEKGLLGSEYYASNPLYPLAKTVGMINMDSLSPFGPARNFSISGSAKLGLLDRLIETARKWDMSYSPDPKPEAGHFFRSDHFPMAKRGVPAISYGSGDDWVDGGLKAGEKAEADYVTVRYHQPADEWQADWPFTGMSHDLEVLYALGRDLANSDAWPNWSEDSEFRTVRDQSKSERKSE